MITKREAQLLFNKLDVDKDGIVTLPEFLSWFLP
jgi:Ca2+-binding EF-hand superfamily protein